MANKTIIKKSLKEIEDFAREWENALSDTNLKKFIKSGYEFNSKDKGWLGNLIQSEIFKIPVNSRPEPDFDEYGIELKVSGLIPTNDNTSFTAKERLVFSAINYETLVNQQDIYESDFLKKNKYILLVFYKYDNNFKTKNYRAIKLISTRLIDLTQLEEFEQIKRDYETVVKLVKEGKAEEISSSLTKYLEACTKGQNANSLRVQPFSDVKAKARAWAFKNKLLTKIFYNTWKKYEFKNYDSIQDVISEILKYQGRTLKSLYEEFDIKNTNGKSSRSSVIKAILKIKRFDEIKILATEQITLKTINLEKNGMSLIEHSPITPIRIEDFNEEQKFEDSDLYNICSSGMLVVVFKKEKDKAKIESTILQDCFMLNFDNDEIKTIKSVYYKTMDLCNNGVVYREINPDKKRRKTYLVHESDNQVIHIRPKAKDSKETYQTKNGQIITKISFSLNHKTIEQKYQNYLKNKKRAE
ncbi:MutH/Sau3AI family endonuclease [Ureaplasma ceti]|uniref:MutH/Sau3AI family endonuclease n=1 Tax=Ureaplasma ceti TaxID=3119530 RepID=A0ABP9U9R2_9BACT